MEIRSVDAIFPFAYVEFRIVVSMFSTQSRTAAALKTTFTRHDAARAGSERKWNSKFKGLFCLRSKRKASCGQRWTSLQNFEDRVSFWEKCCREMNRFPPVLSTRRCALWSNCRTRSASPCSTKKKCSKRREAKNPRFQTICHFYHFVPINETFSTSLSRYLWINCRKNIITFKIVQKSSSIKSQNCMEHEAWGMRRETFNAWLRASGVKRVACGEKLQAPNFKL